MGVSFEDIDEDIAKNAAKLTHQIPDLLDAERILLDQVEKNNLTGVELTLELYFSEKTLKTKFAEQQRYKEIGINYRLVPDIHIRSDQIIATAIGVCDLETIKVLINYFLATNNPISINILAFAVRRNDVAIFNFIYEAYLKTNVAKEGKQEDISNENSQQFVTIITQIFHEAINSSAFKILDHLLTHILTDNFSLKKELVELGLKFIIDRNKPTNIKKLLDVINIPNITLETPMVKIGRNTYSFNETLSLLEIVVIKREYKTVFILLLAGAEFNLKKCVSHIENKKHLPISDNNSEAQTLSYLYMAFAHRELLNLQQNAATATKELIVKHVNTAARCSNEGFAHYLQEILDQHEKAPLQSHQLMLLLTGEGVLNHFEINWDLRAAKLYVELKTNLQSVAQSCKNLLYLNDNRPLIQTQKATAYNLLVTCAKEEKETNGILQARERFSKWNKSPIKINAQFHCYLFQMLFAKVELLHNSEEQTVSDYWNGMLGVIQIPKQAEVDLNEQFQNTLEEFCDLVKLHDVVIKKLLQLEIQNNPLQKDDLFQTVLTSVYWKLNDTDAGKETREVLKNTYAIHFMDTTSSCTLI